MDVFAGGKDGFFGWAQKLWYTASLFGLEKAGLFWSFSNDSLLIRLTRKSNFLIFLPF